MENMLRFNIIKDKTGGERNALNLPELKGESKNTDGREPLNVIRQFPERPDEWKIKRVKQRQNGEDQAPDNQSADLPNAQTRSVLSGRGGSDKVKKVKLTMLISRRLYYAFKLKPCAARAAKEMKLKIVGAENLKSLKSGVIALSNSESRAAYAVLRALGRRKFRMVYDESQLPTSVCGRLGKAGMLLPYGGENFEKRAEYCARRNIFLLYHPEKTFSWQREEPHEFSSDAFDCAARLNLPVVPMFIAYQPSGVKDSAGVEQKYVTLFVLPAIDCGLGAEESKRKAYAAFKRQYESFYGDKLD